jgi:hypothetical protein
MGQLQETMFREYPFVVRDVTAAQFAVLSASAPQNPGVMYRVDGAFVYRYNGTTWVDHAAEHAAMGADYRQIGVSVAGVTSMCLFDQLQTGEFVCGDTDNGDWGRKLFLFSGNPLTKAGTVTALAQTSCTAGNGLKDTAGNAVPFDSATKIVNAWAVSNGDIYFLTFDTGLKNHLWRAKAGTYTVGSDAAYSNKQACVDLGLHSGVQSTNIRSLSHRTFLEATVGGASHLFLCEYNVNGARTPGSGGAGADQAVVWRSTDGGNTWAIFMEFNTGGAHQAAHFHGAVQDPYTGWIYFMLGDFTTEPALIAYNGTASALAANTPYATIATTPGYKVISGSELNRYCDLCFSDAGIFSIPDSDSEGADTSATSYVSTLIPRTLDYVMSKSAVERATNAPPVIAAKGQDFALFASFFSSSGDSKRHNIWAADSKTGGWTLVAKIKNNSAAATCVPANFFVDKLNPDNIWLSFGYAQGGYVTAASQSGSSVLLNPSRRGGVVTYAAS